MTETTEAPALDLDLDAIRKRADAATAGPWRLISDFCDCQPDYGCRHGEFPHAVRLPVHKASARRQECNPADPLDSISHDASDFGDLTMETAEFIAAARSDVPALLAEIERLRRIVNLVTELTHDTDGDDLDPDTDIPVGEVMRALAGESA